MQVGVGGLNAFVTQPERNHGDIDPALKQSYRGAVANHMGRGPFSLEAWTTAGRSLYCFAKQQTNGNGAQSLCHAPYLFLVESIFT